jgi:hypothetical protein
MTPSAPTNRLRIWALALLLAVLAGSCGGNTVDFAGGGTGGTGISSGAITAFGSVVVNGVHFRTDGAVAPGFKTKKLFNGANATGLADQEVFSVGMVVTVRHGAEDNNASEIDYRNNVVGPVAAVVSGTDNVIEVLGQTVVIDNAVIFSALKRNDLVEVSGFADASGRIVATSVLPAAPPANEFELKGYVSGASVAAFRLGALPGGAGATVGISYDTAAISGLPGGPADGMYVHVVTGDREPDAGVLAAARIERIASRTEFPEGAAVELGGLVTAPWSGAADDPTVGVEGKTVRWDAATVFEGGTAADLQVSDPKVQVQGTETGGVVYAARIVFL